MLPSGALSLVSDYVRRSKPQVPQPTGPQVPSLPDDVIEDYVMPHLMDTTFVADRLERISQAQEAESMGIRRYNRISNQDAITMFQNDITRYELQQRFIRERLSGRV